MEHFTFTEYNVNPNEKTNENINKNSLFPLKIKILVVYYFSGAIYNAEKCKKNELKWNTAHLHSTMLIPK
jgi:hypothetical protein